MPNPLKPSRRDKHSDRKLPPLRRKREDERPWIREDFFRDLRRATRRTPENA